MAEKRFIAHIDNLYPVRITGILDKSTNTELTVFDEVVDCLNALHEENEQLKKENESLKQTIETQNFNYNNAKSIIHSSEKQIWRLEDRNEQLKKGMIEVVDRYIRNVEHNPPSSTKTYLKVKGALDNVREGLRDLLEDLE